MSDVKIDETSPVAAAGGDNDQRHAKGTGLTIAFVLLIFGLFIYDFRDIIMANVNRKNALATITLGARITQAERELNEAGYNTLYLEGPPTSLFVSTLQHRPLIVIAVTKLLPPAVLKSRINNYVRDSTGFFITSNPNGSVLTGGDGKPKSFDYTPK